MLMIVRQVELWDQAGHGKIVWVDAELPIKTSSVVVGKDGKQWRAGSVYQQTHVWGDIHRDWRIGGLE